MSQWEDKFSEHAIHASLDNLAERLDDETLVTEDLNVLELIDRVRQAKSYTEIYLQNLIPALVNHTHLNNANSYIGSITSELNSYISNSNVGHLNNTSAHIDNLMAQINALPIAKPTISEQSFTQSLIEFKTLAESSLADLKKSKDELLDSVNTVSDESTVQKEKLEELASEIERHEQNISDSLNSLNERFEASENNYTEKLESTTSEFDEKYQTFSAEFNSRLDENFESNKEKVEAVITEHREEYSQQLEKQTNDANSVLNALEEKKEEASNLLQIIGNIGITGNYQNIANDEKKAADIWRRLALGLMAGMVLIIGVTIFISATDGFDWKLALFRVGAAFVLAIPAAYAAKESAKHRALENHNRRAELELASLDPYLEKLPKETRDKVKEELTKKFFGLNETEHKLEEPVSNKAIFELLTTAIGKK
jgi:myosin heavy subunit